MGLEDESQLVADKVPSASSYSCSCAHFEDSHLDRVNLFCFKMPDNKSLDSRHFGGSGPPPPPPPHRLRGLPILHFCQLHSQLINHVNCIFVSCHLLPLPSPLPTPKEKNWTVHESKK